MWPSLNEQYTIIGWAGVKSGCTIPQNRQDEILQFLLLLSKALIQLQKHQIFDEIKANVI